METKELEFESRAMLTADKYKEILTFYLGNSEISHKEFHLINDYFETDNKDLSKHKLMLRVRKSHSQFDLTLKVPLSKELGDTEYHQYLEQNEYLNLKENNIFPNGNIKDKIESFGVSITSVKYKTSLNCFRHEFYFDNHIIILDKNAYGDILDFNIEIEASSKENAINKNLELAKRFSYEFKDSYKTKFVRVLDSID